MKRLLLLWFILSLSSCVHTPIRTLPDHINSISIPIFTNQTFQYGLEGVLTNMVIEEFIKDGRLKVVDRESADAKLNGTIISYERVPFSYDNKGNVDKYRVSISVRLELTDVPNNKLLWQEQYQEVVLYIPPTSSYQPKDFDLTSEQEAIHKTLSKIAYYIVSRTIKD
ncbi:MAG: LptE family protein [bacterium]|nr:LptE family protein [bacterium]